MKRILLVSLILAAMLLSGCVITTTPETTPAPAASTPPSTQTLAKTVIWLVQFGGEPVDKSPLAPPGQIIKRDIILFNILIEPFKNSVSTETFYYALLLSKNDYLYAYTAVRWTDYDFAGPEPGERDIGKIQEAEGRPQRLIELAAPYSDKDLVGLYDEYYSKIGYYEHPEESVVNNIAKKYVKVIVVDRKGFDTFLARK